MKKNIGKTFLLIALLILVQAQCDPDNCRYKQFLNEIGGGEGFIQLGNWRIGAYSKFVFSFSHRSGLTPLIYRSDGVPVGNNGRTNNLWQKKGGAVSQIKLLQKCIQFDSVWRLCEMDNSHLSLSCLTFQTGGLWRVDGQNFFGPRQDFNGFIKNSVGVDVKFGERFVQLGYWRIGEVDNGQFSIGTETVVSMIMRTDGSFTAGQAINHRIERPITKVFECK